MPTAAALIQTAMGRVGRDALGIYLANTTTLTAIPSTTTFTAPQIFMNGMLSNNSFLGWAVWRPGAATAADYVRHITSIVPSTGVATVDVAWADSTIGTEDAYLLPPGIEPYMVINALQNALKKAYFWNQEPLSKKPAGTGIADAGFQNTATSAFSTYGTTTFTKHTTANSENVFRGIASGKIVNTAATSGIYQQYEVEEGEQIVVHNLSMLASGTSAQLELYDSTNSALIGTTVEHNQRRWQYMRRVEAIPTGCTLLTVRHLGEGANDTVYFNGVFAMPANTKRLILDTRWDTADKVGPGLAVVRFGRSVASNTYDAFAATLEEIPRDLYKFDFEKPGANPSAIQFFDGIESYLQYPVYIQGRRAYADLYTVTMADVATSIPIDTDLWDGLFRSEFYSQGEVQRRISDWTNQLRRASWDAQQATRKFPKEPPDKTDNYVRWGSARV